VNDLTRMIERMKQADQAAAQGRAIESLRILMGWTCSGCGKDFEQGNDGPLLAVRLTVGLPILCPACREPKP